MQLITQIVVTLLSLLSKDVFKKAVDALLDKIEEHVVNSPNKLDDAIVLPLCRKARKLLDVPDDDNVG